MAVTTVAQFASELNRPAATLLEQLQSAGVAKATTDDALNDADKERLLDYLRTAHGTTGGERKKITLTRKSTSEIKQADASGKARTIQVEVRKKRTFVQRDDSTTEEQAQAAAAAEEAELVRREEEARAQAALMRQQEEELAEKRRVREAEEARVRAEAEERARAAAEAAEKANADKIAADAARAAAEAAKPKVAMTKSAKDAAAREAAAAAAAAAAAPAPAAEPAPEPVAPPPEPVRQVRVIKAADAAEEESKRMNDLQARRKAAEAEAAAIRAMMSAPKKVLTAPKPEPPKPVDAAGIKGTIHKAKAAPGAPAAPGAKPGDKKAVKSEKLSSSWADDAAKKRGEAGKGRGAPSGAAAGAGRPGWRAPRGGARGGRDRDSGGSTFQAPTEMVVQEVHVPETISVADLAHKMSVKASEVIKQLMKLGQMVTINQQLDQETAMIVVEEMGHKAITVKLDDSEAFSEEEKVV